VYSAPRSRSLDVPERAQIQEALTGPITSIRTPFRRGGTIDTKGLHNTIDLNITAGSRTVLLTAGDSHLISMSDQDIAEVTKAVVDHTAGRAVVVTADRHYNTNQAIAFAEFATNAGAGRSHGFATRLGGIVYT
jgi:dihydrodipicolinate synthase/N-acetylneuraminate lyase